MLILATINSGVLRKLIQRVIVTINKALVFCGIEENLAMPNLSLDELENWLRSITTTESLDC